MTLSQTQAGIQARPSVRQSPVFADMKRQIELYKAVSAVPKAEYADERYPLELRLRDLIPGYGLIAQAKNVREFLASRRNAISGAVILAYHASTLYDLYGAIKFLA